MLSSASKAGNLNLIKQTFIAFIVGEARGEGKRMRHRLERDEWDLQAGVVKDRHLLGDTCSKASRYVANFFLMVKSTCDKYSRLLLMRSPRRPQRTSN